MLLLRKVNKNANNSLRRRHGFREKYNRKTESTKKVSFDVEAGKTYFVEGKVTWGLIIGRPKFKLVEDKEKALKGLKQCSIMLDNNE